jgi:hypothetical protein
MTQITKGIHIIPTGFEYDRIVLPMLKDYNVKKGYILINKSNGKFSEQRSVINGFIKKLEELPFDHEKVEMDFYDFDDTFQKVHELINKELKNGNPVYINISSASRIVLPALVLAAMLNREYGDVKLFYVEPEGYYEGQLLDKVFRCLDPDVDIDALFLELKELAGKIKNRGLAYGEKKIHEFPAFPIASLNENEYRALDILMKRGQVDSIKELIEILKQYGDDEKVARSSIRYSLQRLEALGLIRMRQEKKKVVIEATKTGELYGKTSCKNINIRG